MPTKEDDLTELYELMKQYYKDMETQHFFTAPPLTKAETKNIQPNIDLLGDLIDTLPKRLRNRIHHYRNPDIEGSNFNFIDSKKLEFECNQSIRKGIVIMHKMDILIKKKANEKKS